MTGEGLAEALVGAGAVIDVAKSPSFEDEVAISFCRHNGVNLLADEQVLGVCHHVALSVSATERLQQAGHWFDCGVGTWSRPATIS